MWSIKYKACIKCGTITSKHAGHGICKKCNSKEYERSHANIDSFGKIL